LKSLPLNLEDRCRHRVRLFQGANIDRDLRLGDGYAPDGRPLRVDPDQSLPICRLH
jgi:hypothetical protein